MALNLKKFAKTVEAERGRIRFEVDPDKAYPAALEDLQDATKRKADDSDFERTFTGILARYRTQAWRMKPRAWTLALTPRWEVKKQADLTLRAELLELARLWFTEHLHASVEHKPMALRILKSEQWRLK